MSYDVSCITNKEKWDTVSSIGMVRVYRKVRLLRAKLSAKWQKKLSPRKLRNNDEIFDFQAGNDDGFTQRSKKISVSADNLVNQAV